MTGQSKPLVLVTTPNGRTGSAAVQELLQAGYPVRALVRRDDARAKQLRARGVDVVVGDLLDWRDLTRATDGVRRAYHCSPFDEKSLHGGMLFALAAEQAGVEVVALMSGWNPHPSHPSIMQREHWIANNIYRRLGSIDVIHLNPGMFAFTYLLGLPAVAHFGRLMLPFGDGVNAPPSNEDIGAVAAHALMNPAPYIGRCLRPMGPTRVHSSDVARMPGDALDRPVKFQDVPTSMFAKAAMAQGFPLFQIAQVRRYADELRAGAYGQEPTDHVAEVTGRPPQPMADIVRRYVADPSRIAPGMEVGSFWSALAFVARMVMTRVPDLDQWEQARDYPLIRGGVLAHQNPEWLAAASDARLLLLPSPARV